MNLLEPCQCKSTTASVGWNVAKADWGNGFATQAAQAVLQFAFAACKVDRVSAYCDRANVASVRVMEKLGMWRQNTAWEGWMLALHYLRCQPVVHYSLMRTSYQTWDAPNVGEPLYKFQTTQYT